MSVLEMKKKIEQLNTAITEQQKSLALLRQQIVTASKPFVKECIKHEIEQQVKSNSEHTKELGKDALTEMKKQLLSVLDNSDALVDDIFGDDELWVHVNYKVTPNGDRFGQGYNKEKLAKENIHKGIKIALGEAGKILIKYKYLSPGKQYTWDYGMRYDYSRANKGESRLMYAYGLSLPEELFQMIEKYSKGIWQLHEASCQLMDSQKALSEQEAIDLWNEV